VYSINEVTLRQTITPDRMQGRVNAAMEAGPHGMMLLGALAGGLLGEVIGLRGTLVVGACGMLLAAAWLAASPVRGLRATPSLPAVEPVAPLVTEMPS